MKILLAIALLCLTATAQANHHREHLTEHLLTVSKRLESSAAKVNWFAAQMDLSHLSAEDQVKVRAYVQQAQNGHEGMLSRISIALALLADKDNPAVLDDVRDILNSPNDTSPSIGRSFEFTANRLISVAINFDVEPNNILGAGGSLYYLVHGWRVFEFAIWHVNDAIREEVYNDPAFICAGPNNHCE